MTPAIRLLEQRQIPHRVLAYEHDPAVERYGQEAAEALGLDPRSVFKTLLAEVAGLGPVVAIIPVDCTLDLKALARTLGAKKATMAAPATAARVTGYVLGGISPLGQKTRLPTVLDRAAVGLDTIHVSGGRRGLELALAPSDLATLTNATVAPIGR